MARCRYDQCQIKATFNVVGGSKRPLYCKKHAEQGMVNVRSKPCSHESCTRRPSYNFNSTKTPAYCKQHVQDGMVNVRSKRCAFDSCMRQPYFNFKDRKTTVYCKEHAEDGMVDVLNRRCLHDSCMFQRSFNVEGSKTGAYCKKHAKVGMVNIRVLRHASKDSGITRRARDIPFNVAATEPATQTSGILNGSAASESTGEDVHCRKRLRRELDGEPLPQCLDQGSFQGGGSQTFEICSSMEVPGTSFSAASQMHLSDEIIGTDVEKTGQVTTGTLTPLPNASESGEPVKTEMELVVMV